MCLCLPYVRDTALVTRRWGCVGTGCDSISRVSARPFIRLGGLSFPFSAGSMGRKLDTPGSFPQFLVPRGLYGVRFQVEILRRWRRRDPLRPCGPNHSRERSLRKQVDGVCICHPAFRLSSSSQVLQVMISKLFFVVMRRIASFIFTKHYLVKQC